MSNGVVSKKNKIVSLIENDEVRSRIVSFLGEDKLPRFKSALLNIALDRQLADASPESIVKSALAIAELKLPLSKSLGLAYIVKYKKEAQPQIGYKGWRALLRRAGIYVKARPVYACDYFEAYHDGFEDKYLLKPSFEDRNEADTKWIKENLLGVWVSVRYAESDITEDYFVTKEKIEQLANLSPALRARKGFSPYESGFILEMYLAKAVGWVSRRLGVDDEVVSRAFEVENETCELPNMDTDNAGDVLDVELDKFDEEAGDEAGGV